MELSSKVRSADHVMPCEIWRNIFSLLPSTDLIHSRMVCKTFRDEAEYQLHKRERLGIIGLPEESDKPYTIVNCFDCCNHRVSPQDCIINSSKSPRLSILGSLFPSTRILVMQVERSRSVSLEKILQAFPELECATIQVNCHDMNENECVAPNLKHLTLQSFSSKTNFSFPSLESLEIKKNYNNSRAPLTIPSHRLIMTRYIAIDWKKLPSSTLQVLDACINFGGYRRRFQPTFPCLTTVSTAIQPSEVNVFRSFLLDNQPSITTIFLSVFYLTKTHIGNILSCLSSPLRELKLQVKNAAQVKVVRNFLYTHATGLKKLSIFTDIDRLKELSEFMFSLPDPTHCIHITIHCKINDMVIETLVASIIDKQFLKTSIIELSTEKFCRETWSQVMSLWELTHTFLAEPSRRLQNFARITISRRCE